MLYHNYQVMANSTDPVRLFADHARSIIDHWWTATGSAPVRRMAAYYEQVGLLGFTHVRRPFLIAPVSGKDGTKVEVEEEAVHRTAFCELVRFRKKNAGNLPKVLLVAPMSGHFATLPLCCAPRCRCWCKITRFI